MTEDERPTKKMKIETNENIKEEEIKEISTEKEQYVKFNKMDTLLKGGQEKNIMKEGDLVIAYLFKDNLKHFFIQKDKKFFCKFGVYSHNNMIVLFFTHIN
jgi:tRNA (adenine57-N1/adenine58-N1)-methyltransferase catalytic subunit